MANTAYAKVQTTFTATHRWEDAPESVEFLQDAHRHEFHVKALIEQFHDDRDVEYIQVKRKIDSYLEKEYDQQDLDEMSCEMIANDIISFIKMEIEDSINRFVQVEVLEDGENGAVVLNE